MKLLSFFRDFCANRASRKLCNGLKFRKQFADDEYVARRSRRGRKNGATVEKLIKLRESAFHIELSDGNGYETS
jgi:hypothetical protein